MPKYVVGRLRVEDFEKMLEYNEVDLARKIREVDKKSETIADKILRGNKTALVDLRKLMNDNINLSLIMRDMIAVRQGNMTENTALISTLERARKSLEIDKRKERVGRANEYVKEKIRQARLAEQIRKDELKQKIKVIIGTLWKSRFFNLFPSWQSF